MTTRKEFMIASSLVAAAPTIAAAANDKVLLWTFDRDKFNAILANPAPHKQCFGAVKLQQAGVLDAIGNSRTAYAKYYPNETFAAVAVLYHGSAIGLAMNDSVWNDILVPWLKWNPEMKTEVPEAAAGAGNPYLKSSLAKADLGKGTWLLVCHNAITGFAYGAADVLHKPVQKVHDDIVAGMIPGALVVPAGVMAINACQEAKFSYLQTSV